MLDSGFKAKRQVYCMRKYLLFFSLFPCLLSAQVRLMLDSQLRVAYEAKYHFSEGLMCVPFYCDPFFEKAYKKGDTNGLCGRYVFVNKKFEVKIKPGFTLPCWFEPRFSEGLCAVNINNTLAYIDTNGQIRIQTDLAACTKQRNKAMPFKNGRARILKGSSTLKHYYEVYYIDRTGKRLQPMVNVKVKPKVVKKDPLIVVVEPPPPPPPHDKPPLMADLPISFVRGKYPIDSLQAQKILREQAHADNRMLLYFGCGQYQYENMDIRDTVYCGKFVFTDSLFQVRIAGGFSLPCGFEPEFSEGLCAVAIDSMIVYIDTAGRVLIQTGLKACGKFNNKASTFRNGIATLYQSDLTLNGLYTTQAINTKGERVRLLEYDDLELAEKKLELFSNLTAEEAQNCFVGRGKSNGLWFLIEKSGKVRKKLELKKK